MILIFVVIFAISSCVLYTDRIEFSSQIIRSLNKVHTLLDFINQPIRTYSAGMKARLGLAVASAIRPNILLIDEVLGVGDPNFREKSKKKILSMVEGASTVVIVSHSFGLMTDVCDRVVLLDHGKIVTIGDPQAAIKAYYDLGEK